MAGMMCHLMDIAFNDLHRCPFVFKQINASSINWLYMFIYFNIIVHSVYLFSYIFDSCLYKAIKSAAIVLYTGNKQGFSDPYGLPLSAHILTLLVFLLLELSDECEHLYILGSLNL